jgi:hypothetical protein
VLRAVLVEVVDDDGGAEALEVDAVLVLAWDVAAAGWAPPELLEAPEPPHPVTASAAASASAMREMRMLKMFVPPAVGSCHVATPEAR